MDSMKQKAPWSEASFVQSDQRVGLLVCLSLMVATYVAFSLRTIMDPVDPGELLSLKRLVASVVGAGMCWIAVQRIRRFPLAAIPARLFGIASILVAGAGFVLASRIAFDFIVEGQTQELLARNIRWVITWLGYFTAAVMAYIAMTFANVVAIACRQFQQDGVTNVANLGSEPVDEQPQYEEADVLLAGLRQNTTHNT